MEPNETQEDKAPLTIRCVEITETRIVLSHPDYGVSYGFLSAGTKLMGITDDLADALINAGVAKGPVLTDSE